MTSGDGGTDPNDLGSNCGGPAVYRHAFSKDMGFQAICSQGNHFRFQVVQCVRIPMENSNHIDEV